MMQHTHHQARAYIPFSELHTPAMVGQRGQRDEEGWQPEEEDLESDEEGQGRQEGRGVGEGQGHGRGRMFLGRRHSGILSVRSPCGHVLGFTGEANGGLGAA